MKANKNGQGVIPDVDTGTQTEDKKYLAEKRRFAGIITETMEQLSSYVHTTQSIQTYRANMILEIAMAVMCGIQECASKSGSTGTIRVVVRPVIEKCKVELSYNTVLYENDSAVGKVINKKRLYDGESAFMPIDCEDFDERQIVNTR